MMLASVFLEDILNDSPSKYKKVAESNTIVEETLQGISNVKALEMSFLK